MNALVLLIVSIIILALGYFLYGKWIEKVWGVREGEDEDTPAHNMEDGVDYVPTSAPVLMGHHFSSISGAGPITGPIAASMFGWVPVTLWILVGGIFFGGVHDFGALYASICHKGQTIGEIISSNMSRRAKRLFIIFSYLTLILVVAAFSSIVATSFKATYNEDGSLNKEKSATNASVAMVSLLFILIAVIYGFLVHKFRPSSVVATVLGVIAIVCCLVIGIYIHPFYFSANKWMIIVGAYIFIASVTPVWILLQPRDYLSSFLLYSMVIVAIVGIFGAQPSMDSFEAFSGFTVTNANGTQFLFPILFTTVACGAISGFHSLVSSGTTSKQLGKKKEARPIAYGGMLLECVIAIITLCAIAFAKKYNADVAEDKKLTSATAIFAGGISKMVASIRIFNGLEKTLNTLIVVTYSAFCLTSLDTATRLARFMFQEYWLEPGQTVKDIKSGWKKIMINPYFATSISVILGVALGLNGYEKIWGLFGAANQLLAGIGLLTITTWLGNIGKNNKMLFIPMAFMMVVTISSLVITVVNQIKIILNGKADWGPYAQTFFGVLLVVLSLVLLYEGIITLLGKNKKETKIIDSKDKIEINKTEEEAKPEQEVAILKKE